MVLKALEECEWFLVVLSPRSVASEWVKDEVHWAISHRQGKVITVLIEDCSIYKLHIRLPRIQYVDFRNDLHAARVHLLMTWNLRFKPEPRTEMQLLVDKHSLCRYQNDRLAPCRYHRDRMEVRLYEKAGHEGEVDLSGTHVRLTPHPKLLDLLVTMQMKTQVAGHWGLMKEHRDWIAESIRNSLTKRLVRGQNRINILQCGVAGPVHYFANIAILLEQIDEVVIPGSTPPVVSLSTRDICPGSTRPIEVLLGQLEGIHEGAHTGQTVSSRSEPFHYVDVDGYVIWIDETLWDLVNRVDLLDARIRHDLAVEDLTSDTWSERSAACYDVVMSHHLLSMWGNDVAKVERMCSNLSAHTITGSEVLLAMNIDRNDSSRLSLVDYHALFAKHGFLVDEARLAWDVYDLDRETISRLLIDQREVDVMKDCALVRYVRS
jgi:hypothetical protein